MPRWVPGGVEGISEPDLYAVLLVIAVTSYLCTFDRCGRSMMRRAPRTQARACVSLS